MNLSGHRLIYLPSILALADIAATLVGQPDSYWRGDYTAAHDANPAVVFALGISPWLSLPAAVLWVALIAFLMLYTSPLWRRRIYLFLCISHFVFVAGWIIRYEALLIIPVALTGVCIAALMRKQFFQDLKRTLPAPVFYATGSTAL